MADMDTGNLSGICFIGTALRGSAVLNQAAARRDHCLVALTEGRTSSLRDVYVCDSITCCMRRSRGRGAHKHACRKKARRHPRVTGMHVYKHPSFFGIYEKAIKPVSKGMHALGSQ